MQIAKESLMAEFALSDAQSQAIVDMRLRALTGLEREKLENEYKELQVRIAELKAILADEKKLPFNTAVEVSYLRSEEQQILLQYMSNHNMVPSMKQAKELKQISKERMLTYSEIDQICMNESTEKVQVQIPAKKLKQYFPESYSKAQIEEVIFMLLASWAEKQ